MTELKAQLTAALAASTTTTAEAMALRNALQAMAKGRTPTLAAQQLSAELGFLAQTIGLSAPLNALFVTLVRQGTALAMPKRPTI
ncbi:hypothetical protein [Lacticaseibacillus absianus]|uniref:hypothetical protein n=1 Tax=Lacticaseibacillus absianus TaxID=2729623 RepID=UPI0015CB27D3|nr:hypothetical protein [Lacticaseibacillus absianus]